MQDKVEMNPLEIVQGQLPEIVNLDSKSETDSNAINNASKMTKEVKRKAKNERLIEKMKKEFLELDFDGDGTISTEEIERVLHTMRIKLKINELDIKHLLQDIDKDKNGSVDLKEYYRYMKGRNGTIMKTNLLYRALFQLSLIRKELKGYCMI